MPGNSSDFSRFMRANKAIKGNEKFAVTKSLTDTDGNPLLWEFRRISSKENSLIQDEVMTSDSVKNKAAEYLHRLIAKSTVYPDLYDSALQDSYNARTPEELLYAMVDDIGEYNALAQFIQIFQGLQPLSEKVDEAKN